MRAFRLSLGFGHIAVACLSLMLASCDGTERDKDSERGDTSESRRPIVVTSHYPLYFFANRIANGIDTAPDVVLPEIQGDPASWVPSTAQIQRLQSADLIIVNGAGAEPWLDWVTLDQSRIIDTSREYSGQLIALEDSVLHQHGPKGDHSRHATAFSTWLDPRLVIDQAQAVERALAALAPEHAAQYKQNMSVLENELMQVDTRLADVFAQLQDRPVFFSHPVYQYLQRRYSINSQSLHWEPDKEPTTPGWIEMQQRLASHPATIMIWEDEPLPTTVRRLEQAGISSVVFHTCANRPTQGDFITVMLENARRLQELTTRKKRLPIPHE